MNKYAVINNGRVVNIVQATSPKSNWVEVRGVVNIGYRYDGVNFLEDELVEEGAKRITRLKFKQRLLSSERIKIRERAKFDGEVFDFQDLLDTSTYIELDAANPDGAQVHYAVTRFEQLGLLEKGRASTILNTPVQDNERYKGE